MQLQKNRIYYITRPRHPIRFAVRAFAFSSDFRHAAVEVFEDEGDDYSRVSSASADRGTADAVTLINYTAINCKGGRKGMEASFLAKP